MTASASDVGELVRDYPFVRLAQHRLGVVDADDALRSLPSSS
jgi:hypothetical protein